MQPSTSRRPGAVLLLTACLLFQAISATFGGFQLVDDPSGGSLEMPVSMLAGSPFSDFLIPGLVLLVVLGLFPLAALWGVWRRQCWGLLAARLIGIALLIWIGVQISVVGYSPRPPLQLIYGTLGAIIVSLALVPSVRRDVCTHR